MVQGAEIAAQQGVAAGLNTERGGRGIDDDAGAFPAADGGGSGEHECSGHLVCGLTQAKSIDDVPRAREGDARDEGNQGAEDDEFDERRTAAHGRVGERDGSRGAPRMARFAGGADTEFAPIWPFLLGSCSMTTLRARAMLVALTVAAGACYQDPEQAIAQEQAMTDLGDAVNQLSLQMAELTAEVDSLKLVIARQDTAVYRMANVTGVPYQR